MTARSAHLFLYNSMQALGWGLCLYRGLATYIHTASPAAVFKETNVLVRLFQMASILEILHAVVGLVPSSPVTAGLQWAGRSHVLFLVLQQVPQVQSELAGTIMILAWALAEVIRYPWYALNIVEACPKWLTWLRYTMFLPLYPLGVVCEMVVLARALPHLQARRMFSLAMPNAINFAFEYHVFIKVLLVLYVPIWYTLFSSMLKQRRKKLGSGRGQVSGGSGAVSPRKKDA